MLLGFKKQFVAPIQIGTKVFTLRKPRKVKPKIGETLYMYCGLRTNNCFKISAKEKLISTQKCRVVVRRNVFPGKKYAVNIQVDNRPLTEQEIEQFVKFDGFKDVFDFVDYWCNENKKKGLNGSRVAAIVDMYHWTDLRY